MTDAAVVTPGLVWRRLHWAQPVPAVRATAVLRAWAADQRSPRIALEARATNSEVRYLIGRPPAADTVTVLHGVASEVNAVSTGSDRLPVQAAIRLTASTRHRATRTDNLATVVRVILAALTRASGNEELVLQLLLGPRRVPLAIPTHSPSALVATPWEIARWGNGKEIDGEKRSALRSKVSDHGYACTVRLGVRAATSARRKQLLLGLLAAVRTSEAAGVRLRPGAEPHRKLDEAARPWRWPLRLNVGELTALTAWPLDDDDLPGQPAAHPKLLSPAPGTTGRYRIIATATAPGVLADLAISARNALQHVHVIGPTGAGKSTLLAGLIGSDIHDGRAVVVIEPKGDLIRDVLARVPDHRRHDIVILDPADTYPVGLNPLHGGARRAEVIADSVLAIFKQLYGDAIGPRSADILHAGLLTLAQREDASLVELPLLLTHAGFRRRLTAGLRDPIALEPFWAGFERWSDAEQAAAIAPVMNKLRPLLRPSLRAVLGQRQPRFSMRQVFTERKILLVPLQRGIIGPDASALLGSLVVAELWQTIQERAAIPAERRHPVTVYIDEVQDYLHLPTDLADALAQARGLGVGFHLAHQFLGQLPAATRNAVLANARSRIVFQTSPADAAELAKGHPELAAEDFTALGAYQIYASLYGNGRVNPYASGHTNPLLAPSSDADALRQASRDRYGQSLDMIEAGFAALLTDTTHDLAAARAAAGGPHDPRHPSRRRVTGRPAGRIVEHYPAATDAAVLRRICCRECLCLLEAPMTHAERARGPGRPGILELTELLTPRDYAVLQELKRHRFLSTTQLQRLLFHDHLTTASAARVCRSVLQRLDHHRLIESLTRRVGGLHAGSAASIWALSSVGQRLLSLERGDGGSGRFREPSQRFVEHYLAVAETLIRVSEAARANRFELTRAQLEPDCWREYLGRHGGREVLSPDLFIITANGAFEDHWFLEVDLGTEHIPTVLRKCAQYERYRRSGREQERSDGVFPLVLWAVQSASRKAKLEDALRTSTGLDKNLYRVATMDDLITTLSAGGEQ